MPRKSWQTKLNEFFENNELYLVVPETSKEESSPHKYLWEDYDAAKKKLDEIDKKSPSLYCYTLVEEDGKAYIISNWHFVNRFAYLISNKKVEPDINLRYW